MPRLEDIEKFKAELNALGHEPSILADKGLKFEDIRPPEGLSDEALSELLAGDGSDNDGDPLEGLFGEEEDNAIDHLFDEPFDADDDSFDEPADISEEAPDTFDDTDSEDFEIPEDLTEDIFQPDQYSPEPSDDRDSFEDEEDPAVLDEFDPDMFDVDGDIPEDDEPVLTGSADDIEDSDDFGIPEDLLGGLDDELDLEDDDAMFDPETVDADRDEADEAGGVDDIPDAGDFPDFEIPPGIEDVDSFALPDGEDEFAVPFESEESGDPDVSSPAGVSPEEFSLFDEGEDEQLPEFSMPEGFPFQEEEPSGEDDIGGEDSVSGDPGIFGEAAESFSLPEDFDLPSAGDIDSLEEDDFEVDEFNLGDLGAQFGEFDQEEESRQGEEEPVPAVSGELDISEEDLELSDGDFEAIQATLARLPLNLKIAIEELIGEKGLEGTALRGIVEKLVSGASARDLAAATGRILGRKFKIPSGYEKSTGEAFELEKGTLAYTLRYNVLPILLKTALLSFVVFIGYLVLFKPVYALVLYNRGYVELENGRFENSRNFFDQGVRNWRYKHQYYRYANGYQKKNQYSLAGRMYGEMINNLYPLDKRAILEYGAMESAKMENHVKAEEIYDKYLNGRNRHDYDVLLAAGDNYLAWGYYDNSKYDEAGHSYAVLIQKYGSKIELLFRMMTVYIRTDNYEHVLHYKAQFDARSKLKIDPYVYTELAGYLVDKKNLDDVRKILFSVLDVKNNIAETHYQLGRYFREVREPEEERKALVHSLSLFSRKSPLTGKDVSQYIDAENRLGEVLFANRENLDAEQHFLKARRRYEDAAARRMVKPSAQFGKIYKNLGDLYYYVGGQLDDALLMFEEGESLGYSTPDVKFKKGYIRYHADDYQKALEDFFSAEDIRMPNTNLMYSLGNAFFKRSDFHAAAGYYSRLAQQLENRRSRELLLEPREREDHQALLENTMRAYNNLGVATNRLAQASNDSVKYNESLVYFTKAMELFNLVSRDPESLARPGNPVSGEWEGLDNLALLNQRALLFPMGDYDLQIYGNIPLDMEARFYW